MMGFMATKKILVTALSWVVAGTLQRPASAASEFFVDATQASGLEFVHKNGGSGQFHFPEIMGAGGALFDFDQDGDLDLYLVQGGDLGDQPQAREARANDRLLRNDLAARSDGTPAPRFTDVTAASGIAAWGYGMGVASGDFDNDGWPDLYVTNFGHNQLLRNLGDGTFADVTAQAGVDDPRWSTSATFFDMDGDGDLDLYVVNYVDTALARPVTCFAASSRRDYCGPGAFPPLPDRLFRNRGNATFEDVTHQLLRGYQPSAGLGVVAGDLNGDQRIDVYVANDGLPNQLWLQQTDGTFRDEALLAGVAVDHQGRAQGSMGIDLGDMDNDADLDLVVTNLMGEGSALYRNDGQGLFRDRSRESGLLASSLAVTGFGAAWLDFDNDGWLDLITANGAVKILEDQARAGNPHPFAQPKQLFRNQGHGQFLEVTAQAGAALQQPEVSRGIALGDVDNDGDTDLVVCNNHGPARLLLNQVGNAEPWIGLRLIGGPRGRDQLGAQVEVLRTPEKGQDGGLLQNNLQSNLWRHVHTDASYCSASDPRVLVGLGHGSAVRGVRVVWPSGRSETWQGIPLRTYVTLREGERTQ